jgi:hypothetical protein
VALFVFCRLDDEVHGSLATLFGSRSVYIARVGKRCEAMKRRVWEILIISAGRAYR